MCEVQLNLAEYVQAKHKIHRFYSILRCESENGVDAALLAKVYTRFDACQTQKEKCVQCVWWTQRRKPPAQTPDSSVRARGLSSVRGWRQPAIRLQRARRIRRISCTPRSPLSWRCGAQRDAQKGLGAFDDAARRGPEQQAAHTGTHRIDQGQHATAVRELTNPARPQ